MIRTAMRLHRPDTVAAAAELLGEHGDRAAVLGGGTWLLPLMGRGERTVDHVISLRGLRLDPVRDEGDGLVLAATATFEDILAHEGLYRTAPALHAAASGITGGVALRSVATPLGAACYANPSSDAPGVLVGHDAELRVIGAHGERMIPAHEFFQGAYRTALAPGELVLEARLPHRGCHVAYVKVKTSGGGWPVATSLAFSDPKHGRAGVTIGAVQAAPLQIDLSDLLAGNTLPGPEAAERVTAAITDPYGDILADAAYRARIAGPVARRAIERLGAAA